MKGILLLLALSGSALALPGSVKATARLYAQPNPQSKVVVTLTARTKLEIKSCQGGPKGWCSVTALGKSGFIPRAQVYGNGACTGLISVGLGDLLPSEASYTGNRDRDRDGLGCDTTQ
ncbi:hypothetical protein Dxin01_03388 [Deinococcus xinjiangensis]|uniref:SH3 domain-containing protein n=1 Tax=Deinococcus xinjiangensis TaxID=457454 RepID=A0ABP9VEI3_9DEIO